jgi:hypothetical protein
VFKKVNLKIYGIMYIEILIGGDNSMIGEYTLLNLCKKYNINSEKIVNNNRVLSYGDYDEINKTLDYLINELKISSTNIEKCPSILYRNVNAIRYNIEFLKNSKIHFSNILSCLHVLSTEPNEIKKTYNYVVDNYGINAINRNSSILAVNKSIIMKIEELNLPIHKIGNLTIAVAVNWGTTTLEDIQKIIQSEEFKSHPEMFTSTTLAHAKLEDIQKIIHSEEFKSHPEMFTSQTLAHAKLEDIKELLKMELWNDERFKNLLTSSIVAKSKSMISKLPIIIQIAEDYGIDRYLNTSFLLFSPSHNYALIQYMNDNNISLITDGKLNPIFGKQPGLLKKKYNIDIKELIAKYPLILEDKNELNGGKKI